MEEEAREKELIEKKKNAIIEMLKTGNDALSRYKHIIGIGVFVMLLIFTFIFINSIREQREIAESCGFDDGKLKCICTEEAWNTKMEKDNRDPFINLSGYEKSEES